MCSYVMSSDQKESAKWVSKFSQQFQHRQRRTVYWVLDNKSYHQLVCLQITNAQFEPFLSRYSPIYLFNADAELSCN